MFSPGGVPFIVAPESVPANIVAAVAANSSGGATALQATTMLAQQVLSQSMETAREASCPRGRVEKLTSPPSLTLHGFAGESLHKQESKGAGAGEGGGSSDGSSGSRLASLGLGGGEVVYASVHGTQALVVTSVIAQYPGVTHGSVHCTARVSFMPSTDRLVMVDIVVLRSRGMHSATVLQHFTSHSAWRQQSTAAATPTGSTDNSSDNGGGAVDADGVALNAGGQQLSFSPVLLLDARGSEIALSPQQWGGASMPSPDSHGAGASAGAGAGAGAGGTGLAWQAGQGVTVERVARVHNETLLVASTTLSPRGPQQSLGSRYEIAVLGAMMTGGCGGGGGSESMGHDCKTKLKITCKDCTLNPAKKGRMRVQIDVTSEQQQHSYQIHFTLRDTCAMVES